MLSAGAVLRRAGVADEHVAGLKRHDFYDYASSAVVIVQTGEAASLWERDSSQGCPLSRLPADRAAQLPELCEITARPRHPLASRTLRTACAGE